MRTLTIRTPDDWHLHFPDGKMLSQTVPATARCFARAIVMPNLVPPIVNAQQALAYKERILAARPTDSDFTPLMTLYLTDKTTRTDVREAVEAGITAIKYYPAGATTNSDAAVTGLTALYPVLEVMAEMGMPLLVHGEVTDAHVDIFDREKRFIDAHLAPLTHAIPALKIVFEHITTAEAVDFVLASSERIAATITPQHLLLDRNDLFVGGIRPHNYCLPVLKRNTHKLRLQKAVRSGSPKFFLGSDSAPHSRFTKESACGCAGCYSAWSALELYAQVFDDLGILDKLEAFASEYGPQFYGLAPNTQTITLVEQAWTIPEQIHLWDQESIVPFYAGQTVRWQLK